MSVTGKLDGGAAANSSLAGLRDIRRLLIMKWSALGDIALTTAVMEDVCRAFPGAEVHINALPPWDQLFRDDPRFSRVITFTLRGKGPRASLRWLHEIRRNDYDLIIDLQSNDRSRLLLTLLKLTGARVPHIIGNHAGYPYTFAPEPLPQYCHVSERQRAALKAAGIPTGTTHPVLYVPEYNRARAARLAERHALTGKRYAVFFPGCQASTPLKRWGSIRFASLAIYLHEAGYDRVVLMGAGDDAEECAAIQRVCGDKVLNLCGQTEVLDLIPFCAEARVIVANDTGTAHLTAATQRPMLVIYGPTDPLRARPVGDSVYTLQASIFCINCYRKQCAHHACMELISPEAAFEVIQRITLGEPRAGA